MATTRFWKIEGTGKNLSNVINYVNNPEKVEPGECLELNLLHLLDYATNEEKTEKSAYVTGINCSVQNSFNEFMTVKEQFGKTGGILAYHGYMSFAEGEVTPDEAHKIGVEFAEKNFPGFQVVVATHLNTDNLHNHFVVNSVSFENGKRIHDEVSWFKFHKLADRICAEHKKSVIRNPKRSSVPQYYKREERAGRNESYNILREVIDNAIISSRTLKELRAELSRMGYRYNLSPNRKYWTVTPLNHERGIRLYHLGEEYTNAAIERRLAENRRKHPVIKPAATGSIVGIVIKRYTEKPGMILSLYRYYMYLINSYKNTGRKAYRIPHAVRQEVNKINVFSEETKYLEKNNITLLSELLGRKKELLSEMKVKMSEREELRNELRRKDNENPEITKDKISKVTEEISGLRKEIRICENIEKRSVRMEENLREEENKEQETERKDEHERSGYGDGACDRLDKDNV